MNERKPVVVIYDDENVIDCLHTELCNAIIAAAKAGMLKSTITESGTVIYDNCNVTSHYSIVFGDDTVSVMSSELYHFDEDFEQLKIKAQIEQKERELARLKAQLNN